MATTVKDYREPLSAEVLGDPEHDFVKLILYIYSMQSFIFIQMNRASRDKDISKIEKFGPLAAALSYIIHCGNQKMHS